MMTKNKQKDRTVATVYEIKPRWSKLAIFNMHKDPSKKIAFGGWVFDDRFRKIKEEPFVGNTNNILTEISKDIPDAKKGFRLQFSERRFEGCQPVPFVKVKEGDGGCWYTMLNSTIDAEQPVSIFGWLCSVLYKYFYEAPDEIWFKASKL